MGTRTVLRQRPGGAEMGQVLIDFSVENSLDRDAPGTRDSVRAAPMSGILMDTGATHLCLPAEVIGGLDLSFAREVLVQVATGVSSRRVFRNALVRFEDREATVECIELPAGMPALLGAIPMESLGIEPDLQNPRVRKLPMGLDGSYITA